MPGYLLTDHPPLIYLPIPSAADARMRSWLAQLNPASPPVDGLTQKQMRQWKRAHPGHRSLTVLRHPLARAHDAYCSHLLDGSDPGFSRIREVVERKFGAPRAALQPDAMADPSLHRAGFGAFLDFLKANLNGQTGLRVDASWASQSQLIAGFSEFVPPDHILREDELPAALPMICGLAGRTEPVPAPDMAAPSTDAALAAIHDADLEARAADVYMRDYMAFGFGPWRTA